MSNTVILNGNILRFGDRINWGTFYSFSECLEKVLDKSDNSMILDFSNVTSAYANGILPIISTLVKKANKPHLSIIPPTDGGINEIFIKYQWFHYLAPDVYPPANSNNRFSLRRFTTDSEQNDITNTLIEFISETVALRQGIIEALEWIINELSGNTLVHSEAEYGWIQVTPFSNNQQLSIVVCDSGTGIPNSMRLNEKFAHMSDLQALQEAIKKGVTSKPEYGQGNGIAGSISLALAAGGQFKVVSGKSQLTLESSQNVRPQELTINYEGTVVDLQLKTDKEISVKEALWGHEPVSHFELKYELDDLSGNHEIRLVEHASSFGNRITGGKIRMLIENILRSRQSSILYINFSEVAVVSSSFADELFGKLIVQMGVINFIERIRFKALNEICKSIIEHSIQQRMAYEFSKRYSS